MNIAKVNISVLNPATYNPRKNLKPDDPEYIKLKRSIQEFGYVEPLVVNKRNNVIIGGHQRYKVLKDLGYKEVDVVFVDLDEVHEKSLNIALNKISGDWDADKLEDLLREINLDDSIDTLLTGFDLSEIETMFGMLEDDNNDDNLEDLDINDFTEDNNENNGKKIYIKIGDKKKIEITEKQCEEINKLKDSEILQRLL
jgi:ParB-like chromosome segregation protein Spo0J